PPLFRDGCHASPMRFRKAPDMNDSDSPRALKPASIATAADPPGAPSAADPSGAPSAEDPPDASSGVRARRQTPLALVAVAVLAILIGSALFATGYVLGNRTATQPGTPADEADAFQSFWDTYAAIAQHYAGEPVPRKQVVNGAIKGMLETLGD